MGSLGRKGDVVLAFGEFILIVRVTAPVGNVVDRDFSSSLSGSDRLPFGFQFAIFNSKQFLHVDLWFRLLKNTKKLYICFRT